MRNASRMHVCLLNFLPMTILIYAVIDASIALAQLSHVTPQWLYLSSKTGGVPGPGPSDRQTASLVLDADKDGSNDFVIATEGQGPSVMWYRRNINGWTKYVIDSSPLSIEAGGTFLDIDGDGDTDIIFGAYGSNEVWWWENPYPHYDSNIPWTRRQIKNSGGDTHHDQIVGDFDGDGEPELVFWNQGAKKLFIADIPAEPKHSQPWVYTAIFSWDSGKYEGLAKFDINGDGKLDIIGGGMWFEHQGGTKYISHIIDDKQRFSRAAAGQLKKGGWAEAVFVAGDAIGRLRWYERIEQQWIGHDLLDEEVVHGHSLELADFDGDGNLDIFCAEMRQWSAHSDDHPDAKMWIFFGDGAGRFEKVELASGYGNHETKVADLDGDGDLDLLIKPFAWDTPRADVWLNNGTKNGIGKLPLKQWLRHVVDPEKPWRAVFIAPADIDGDGKKDIVTGGWWYKNPGRPDGTWKRHVIGSPLNNMAAVYDFDGDGTLDVLGTEGKGSEANANFGWARNDGNGAFTIFRNIAKAEGDFLQGVAVAPFNNLGPLEVALSWHHPGYGIQMLTVPAKPTQSLWPWRKRSRVSQDEQLTVGDIDRDGTLDLLLGTKWLCNECPQYPRRARALDRFLGTNWLRWRVQTLNGMIGNPDRNRLADINGDGRLDAVVGFEAISVPGKLMWYKQPSADTEPWREHMIATVIGPMSLDVADMDGDGDLDVVVGEHNLQEPSSARLYVFENVDGKGKIWLPHLVYTGDEHHAGAIVADIDGDGDLDIVSIGWGHGRVLLYENKAIDR
jgi:FG-GAP-like repeat